MGLSLQQVRKVASAVTDAIRSGSSFPQSDATHLLAAIGEDLPENEISSVIQIFQPVIRGCDWPSYLTQEGLPVHGLTSEEREAIDAPRTGGRSNGHENDPAVQEMRRRGVEHKEWESAESPLLERLELYLGADAEAVKGIAEAIGSVTDAFLTLPKLPGEQLPERLRAALPITALPVTNRHRGCKFFPSFL